jgi:hypothetical protein
MTPEETQGRRRIEPKKPPPNPERLRRFRYPFSREEYMQEEGQIIEKRGEYSVKRRT